MRLVELFSDPVPYMKRKVKNAILDILTPISAHGASKVSIQDILDRLKKLDFGIELDAASIKPLLGPDAIPFVTDMDDNYVYLNGNSGQSQEMSEPDDEPKEDPITSKAKKQAADDKLDKGPPPPKPE
jgi:hypothetical protein